MKYKFPEIKTIDDVLSAIIGRDEFIVAEKDGYTSITYHVNTPETFGDISDPLSLIRRECRGILFDSTTKQIIRRPYHKFFNLGEREETFPKNIDFSRYHTLYTKLDGSMIAPFMTKGHLRWGTKAGITEVSMQAEEFVAKHPKYSDFAKAAIEIGFTPIFEWVSLKQKIVLSYHQDDLILTAMRDMVSGVYAAETILELLNKSWKLPICPVYSTTDFNIDNLVAEITASEGIEGIVLRFLDGHMIKVKSDWYCRIHKAKERISNENDIVDLWLNNALDDVLAFLDEKDKERINIFIESLAKKLRIIASEFYEQFSDDRRVTEGNRKKFAIEHAQTYVPVLKGIAFEYYDKEQVTFTDLKNALYGHLGNKARKGKWYDNLKDQLFPDIEY